MTDYVIAEGTTDGVHWIKFTNGNAILWFTQTKTLDISNSYSASTYISTATNTKALPFVVSSAVVTDATESWGALSLVTCVIDSGATISWRAVGADKIESLPVKGNFVVTGKWK